MKCFSVDSCDEPTKRFHSDFATPLTIFDDVGVNEIANNECAATAKACVKYHYRKLVTRPLASRVVGMDPPFLALRSDGTLVAKSVPGVAAVLDAWRAGKSLRTLQAYADDLADFARYCVLSPEDAVARLFAADRGLAHQIALGYLEHGRVRGLAAATIARRLAALRSLTYAARLIGAIVWTLELPSPKVVGYRDTRGPGRAGFLRLVAVADQQAEPKRARDLAILWLCYGRALRRAEVRGPRSRRRSCRGIP